MSRNLYCVLYSHVNHFCTVVKLVFLQVLGYLHMPSVFNLSKLCHWRQGYSSFAFLLIFLWYIVESWCQNKFITWLFCVVNMIYHLSFGSCQFNLDRFAWLNKGCCRYTFLSFSLLIGRKFVHFFCRVIKFELILLFVEGQPESIVQDIEIMVRAYVEKVLRKFKWKIFYSSQV